MPQCMFGLLSSTSKGYSDMPQCMFGLLSSLTSLSFVIVGVFMTTVIQFSSSCVPTIQLNSTEIKALSQIDGGCSKVLSRKAITFHRRASEINLDVLMAGGQNWTI